MNRRDFMAISGLAALTPMGLRGDSEKGPNLLFIFADQLRSMDLPCYGGTQLRTPHIDRLAREGATFSNAISTYPVCSPFRAMLMSGNFPMKNGMTMNDHFLRNPTPYFGEILRDAGYQTGYIGKWHLDGHGRQAWIPPERRRGFDYWRALECAHQYFRSRYYHQDEKKTRTWAGYDAIAQTDEARAFIDQKAKDKAPFSLFLSWGPPHGPYQAPPEYMERFDPEKIELRQNVSDYAAAEKIRDQCDTALPERYTGTRKSFTARLMDPTNQHIRQWHQGYFAAIETLDHCLGKIIQTLERRRILDDTILVFTSDHGDNLGSHRQYAKQLPYEESISIPFLLRYPRKIPAGHKTDALLTPVDMMPTLLSLAGVDRPTVDGEDLSAAAMGQKHPEREAVLIMRMIWLGTNWITNGSGPWRGVRTKRHTYARIADTGKPWLLFDNQKDPQQIQNLVDEPEYADLVKKLDAETNRLLQEAGDPEDPIKIAQRITEERRREGQTDRADVLFPERVQPGSGFTGLEAKL